jgi:hypothetical protein
MRRTHQRREVEHTLSAGFLELGIEFARVRPCSDDAQHLIVLPHLLDEPRVIKPHRRAHGDAPQPLVQPLLVINDLAHFDQTALKARATVLARRR